MLQLRLTAASGRQMSRLDRSAAANSPGPDRGQLEQRPVQRGRQAEEEQREAGEPEGENDGRAGVAVASMTRAMLVTDTARQL